jgi:hypothetical protein
VGVQILLQILSKVGVQILPAPKWVSRFSIQILPAPKWVSRFSLHSKVGVQILQILLFLQPVGLNASYLG